MRRISLAILVIVHVGACAGAAAQQMGSNPLAESRVFAYDDMTSKTAPNPAHRIQHSELILVEEGTLDYTHDGKTERAGAGSIIYVALGTLHAVRNVGDGTAKYVVIQIGGDLGKQ